jgi:YidC/Oxa1 family membrane protein insertase
MQNNKNLILAMVFSLAFLMLWQYFYENPRQEKFKKDSQMQSLIEQENSKKQAQNEVPKTTNSNIISQPVQSFVSNEVAILSPNRVKFENSKVQGSINPIGLMVDNLTLKKYKTEGTNTILFSPQNTRDAYFINFGFSSNSGITLPNANTKWNIKTIEKNNFIAEWKNDQNITFKVFLKLDENYMFDVSQEVVNNSNQSIVVSPFTRIVRTEPQNEERTIISHEGFVYNVNNTFYEIKYKKLKNKNRVEYLNTQNIIWGGFTDKYWLSSFFL